MKTTNLVSKEASKSLGDGFASLGSVEVVQLGLVLQHTWVALVATTKTTIF